MIIGITGSSGAGKSTACEILSEKYDIEIIDADKIARKLTDTNKDYLNEIVSKFGDDILLPDGTLNRKKLANIIYTDRDKRYLLNSCTFKYIKKEVKDRIKEGKNFAIDAPLLMECKLEKLCDITIAVIATNRRDQLNRIIKRDNISEDDANKRLNAQKPNKFYTSHCDYIILNDDHIKQMEKQLEKIPELSNITK